MKSHTLNRFFGMAMAAVVIIALFLPQVAAYSQPAFKPRMKGIQQAQQSSSALSAWSLPAPAFSTPSLGSSWYNEVDPTGRRTVYSDDPLDYTFSAPGNDWPSTLDSASRQTSQQGTPPQRINVLRRAAKWAFNRKNKSQ